MISMDYMPTKSEEEEYLAYKSADDFFRNLQDGITSLNKLTDKQIQPVSILICGAMASFDKGIISFLNKWSKQQSGLYLLSEVTAQYRRYTSDKVKFPYVCTPHLLAKEMVLLHMDIEVSLEVKVLYHTKDYIQEAVENLEKRHLQLGKGYAKVWCYYAYQYINKLIDILLPQKVILWNEFYAFHHIFKGICKERGIPVFYMEFGCLPGTICIEAGGQQGESRVAKEYAEFRNREVTKKEILGTKKVISFLYYTKLNRNYQPANRLQKRKLLFYKPGQQTIIYFGQNDFESGLVPYTLNTSQLHSPVFKNSLDALQSLRLISIRNNLNLIYKPHPIICSLNLNREEEYEELDVVKDVNVNSVIDFADVVVTILSQCAYIGLIRKKPVLMLGYTQLRGKGCTYEAFTHEEIEPMIIKALENGYTLHQKSNFQKHCAQLLRYYLYDDMNPRILRYGRGIDEICLEGRGG